MFKINTSIWSANTHEAFLVINSTPINICKLLSTQYVPVHAGPGPYSALDVDL